MLILSKDEAIELVHQREAAFAACAESNPFCSPQWVLHFLTQVAERNWKFLVPAIEGAASPLMMLYTNERTGNKAVALTNYYASLYSPIVGGSDRSEAAASLVMQLAQARPRVAAVDLSPMDGDAPEAIAVQKAFAATGWFTRRYFCFGNWYLPCDGIRFADYMEARDSKLYNTWIRKSKKFRPDSDARLEILTNPSDVERGMDAYDSVYAKSWKRPEPYPDFVRGWARICAKEGWLRLGIAWLAAKPIAVQLWFTVHRKAYIFKLAYDEEHSKLSAGTVLGAELFRQSIEIDKVLEIDYLTGDDAYKQSWMSHRRERTGMIACNPATASGLLMIAREAVGELRHRFRRPAPMPLLARATGNNV